MKKLYKFYWGCGSQGDIEGLFISNDKTVEKTIGKEISFGEILGKYSDIFGTLDKEDIEEISEDQEFIKKFESIVGKSFGHNPLSNINE